MSDWKEYKLGDIVKFYSGGTPSKSNEDFWGGQIPWISASSMEGYFYSDSKLKITESGLKNGSRLAPKNSLLLLVRGSILHQKIQVGIAERDVSYNQDVKCLQPNEEIIDSLFLLFWFKSEERNLLNIVENTGIGAGKLDTPVLQDLIIRVPPKNERERLNTIFKSIQDKIELNRQLNITLEAMAQALFKSWFVDFDPVMDNALQAGNDIPDELQAMAEKRRVIANREERGGKPASPAGRQSHRLINTNPELAAIFPSSFEYNETLGKWIPEGWEVKSFGDLIETTIGGDWGKDMPDEKHTEEVKIIRGTDIPSLINCDLDSVPTRYVELKKLKTRKLEEGDIVIEVSGGSPTQSTGRSMRLTNNILKRLGGIVEPASFCRRLKPFNKEYSVLCAEQLTYIYGEGKMWEYQNQSTGIANFQTTYFLNAELVLIPTNEDILNFFYSQVSKLRDKASSNENIILTKLRDTLLPELISGRVRVR